MTLRYTEAKLNQGSGHIQLDAQGKLPALSIASVSEVGVEPTSGLNFKFQTQTTNTFTATQGIWYWLIKADNTLTGTTGEYNITLPSTGVAVGSKVAFSSIMRPNESAQGYIGSGIGTPTDRTFNSNNWFITVPSSAGTGFNSIKAVIKGVTYTEGQTWNNLKGYIREMIFYAYIDSSNNLTWIWFRAGITSLDDFYNFNTKSNALLPDQAYFLKGDGVDTAYRNVREWSSTQITANTTLAYGTNLDAKCAHNLITVNAAASPTITLPAASASSGHVLILKVLPNFKNTTLSSVAGRTKVSGCTIQRAGTDLLSYSSTSTAQSLVTYTSVVLPTSTYSDATQSYSPSVWLLYPLFSTTWAVLKVRTRAAY